MRIPNKFNGYRPDGTRNLHDPLTIAGVVGTGEGLLGAGIASGVGAVGAADVIGTGLLTGSALASDAALGGLASIFSNPSFAGLTSGILPEAAASAVLPEVAQATAFNQATNTAIQEALKQQAAQQTAQNALGYQGFTPPVTPAQNQVLEAFNRSIANPVNPAQFPQYQPLAEAGPGQLVEKAAEAYNPQPIADFSRYTGQTFLPEGMGYQDVVKAADLGSQNIANVAAKTSTLDPQGNFASNLMRLVQNPSMANAEDYLKKHPYATAAGAYGLYSMLKNKPEQPTVNTGLIRPYTLTRTQNPAAYAPSPSSAERTYFTDTYTAGTPYPAPGPEYKRAEGGIVALGVGGPVETMSAMNAVGYNSMYPQAGLQTPMYSDPVTQRPMPSNVIKSGVDTAVDPYTGEEKFAGGGIASLGGYSDGGRLLKGPGDGVSDSIPAVIGDRQPARLADGEFVVPARIVSELGNGSTEAGARKLYAMMDRVQKTRSKTVGKDKVAVDTKADKHLPV